MFSRASGTRYFPSLPSAEALGYSRCAEHVRQFGGESPLHNVMDVK